MSLGDLICGRSALIAYGSETGNAYDYAEELGRILERIHFVTNVSRLDAVEPSHLRQYSVVIIVVSTTGQGDLPINARSFWKNLLRKKLPPTHLEDVDFTIFGLGDTSYPRFNWAARKLYTRLIQLGANEIYPRGEADERHEEGLDASFVPWMLDLRRDLLARFPLADGVLPISEDVLLPPKWLLGHKGEVNNLSSSAQPKDNRKTNSSSQAAEDTRYETELTGSFKKQLVDTFNERMVVNLEENRRVTPGTHWQDVRSFLFTSQTPSPYEPGDVLTIYPQNPPEAVEQIIRSMDWGEIADRPITFLPTSLGISSGQYPSSPILVSPKSPMTLRLLLIHHLDLTAIPRRSFFSLIAHFTTDQFHKERLLEFTKPDYIDEYFDYATRPRRSILEVLQEFESVKIPWQWAAAVLPELRGRQFSIASGGLLKSSAESPTRFELLVAIVKYKTVIKKIREGVCTRYLAALQPGSDVSVSMQKGGLTIVKAEAQRPVIMIAPGTGIAPMRSLIWERLQWSKEIVQPDSNSNGHVESLTQIGQSVLFFGSRNKKADYFYQEEWESIAKQIPLEVHAAFSRDQSLKIYVQDLIRQQSEKVFRLIHESGAIVYVCGSSGKMPQAIRAALADVFKEHGNMTDEAAGKHVESLERDGRYKQETW